MTILLSALIILVNIILQSTIFPYWTIFGYAPNTGLVCVIVMSLIRGRYYGAFFGLVLGLTHDILFGSVIGVNALLYFLIGYLSGILKESLNAENKIVPILCVVLGTIFYNLFYYILLFFLSKAPEFRGVIGNIISIEIIYNSIVSILIYKLFSKMFKDTSLDFRRRIR